MRRMKVGNFSGTCSPLCNLMVHIIIRIWVCWLQLELNYLLQMSQYLSIGLPTLFLSNSDYYDDICLLNMILMQGSDEQLRNLSTDKILQKMKRGGSKNLRWLYLYWLWVSRVSTFRVRFLSTRPHKKKFYCHRSNTNHSLAIGSLSVDEEEAAVHNASRVLLRRINLWFPIIKPNFWVGTQIWEGKGKFFEGEINCCFSFWENS